MFWKHKTMQFVVKVISESRDFVVVEDTEGKEWTFTRRWLLWRYEPVELSS